ncbi:unnamed protein product, partial [Allacma fusca]
FQDVVLKKLAEIQVTQERILYLVGQNQVVETEDFDSLPIPCRSKDELDYLEKYLGSKGDRDKLERYLASFGGPNLKKVVKAILSKLLTDKFAIT